MKLSSTWVLLLLLIPAGVLAGESVDTPIAVSPGSEAGLSTVTQGCPTFSWSAVAAAAAYRIAVFPAPDAMKRSYEELAGMRTPAIGKDIHGAALSWTPTAEERLQNGTLYAWYVQAMDASGNGLGAWSDGKTFKVETDAAWAGVDGKVEEIMKSNGVGEDVIANAMKDFMSGNQDAAVQGRSAAVIMHKGANGSEGPANVLYGANAGAALTSGTADTFIGTYAGTGTTTGSYNTFLGSNAGYGNMAGSSNVFLGHSAGYYETGSNKLYIDNSNTTAPLVYGDFDTDKVGINGWLGVGTQAPAYPIELKTTGRNAAIVANRSDGAMNFINATTTYGQFGTVNNFAVRILANATWKMTLNTDNSLAMASGASCTAGGVWTNASSITLKENVTTLSGDEAAATLQSLNPVKYNYKADKGEEYVGFIAEEVPELVAMADRKSLSPMDIVAVLTRVVKDQQQISGTLQLNIEELAGTMREQEQVITDLEERVARIEKK